MSDGTDMTETRGRDGWQPFTEEFSPASPWFLAACPIRADQRVSTGVSLIGHVLVPHFHMFKGNEAVKFQVSRSDGFKSNLLFFISSQLLETAAQGFGRNLNGRRQNRS